MIDVTGSDDSDVRRVVQNMLECIVRLGMQNVCTLEEFKTLMVGAMQVARQTHTVIESDDYSPIAVAVES